MARAIAEADLFAYKVDAKALLDLARLLFTPRAIVNGRARDATVLAMRPTPFVTAELAARAPPPPEPDRPAPAPKPRIVRPPRTGEVTLDQAVADYNAAHARQWPRRETECPACRSPDGFKAMGSDPTRWNCFSARHDEAGMPGIKGAGMWHGDALDIDAHEAKLARVDFLRREGYLPPPAKPREEPPIPDEPPGWLANQDDESSPIATPANATPALQTSGSSALKLKLVETQVRPLRSRSYLTTLTILSTPRLRDRFMGGKAIEFDELRGVVTIAREALTDHDSSIIRSGIERSFQADEKKNGMKQSLEDIERALGQIAQEHRYHPVQEYLRLLKWDGQDRIEWLARDILGLLPNEQLERVMLRKWLVSAVARAMRPGCKVDTVLVLTGDQGFFKSTFFTALVPQDAWYCGSTFDPSNKDGQAAMSGYWIYEWPEASRRSRGLAAKTA